jgi:hypothetical protein
VLEMSHFRLWRPYYFHIASIWRYLFSVYGSSVFLTSSLVIIVSLFFSESFSRAFLKKSLGDLCFGIVKSHTIVGVEYTQ